MSHRRVPGLIPGIREGLARAIGLVAVDMIGRSS
jgi:hypothetical protein